MTITQERPVQLEEAERVPAEAPAAVARQPWAWVEVEEVDPPAAPTGWMTRFAWAKTAGGW